MTEDNEEYHRRCVRRIMRTRRQILDEAWSEIEYEKQVKMGTLENVENKHGDIPQSVAMFLVFIPILVLAALFCIIVMMAIMRQ